MVRKGGRITSTASARKTLSRCAVKAKPFHIILTTIYNCEYVIFSNYCKRITTVFQQNVVEKKFRLIINVLYFSLEFLRKFSVLYRVQFVSLKVAPGTNLGYEIMIALAKQDGSSVVVYDENGNTMFYRLGELVGFTSTTVSIKSGSFITVYDEHGNTKFVR